MQVVLQVRNGPGLGHVFQLKTGQRARVGRSEWCEFPLPDADLADEHFAVECGTDDCSVRGLSAESEIQVNGDPVAESLLADGDVITAGTVEFAVFLTGASNAKRDTESVEAVSAESGSATPLEVAESAGLSDAGKSLAADAADVGELLGRLEETGQYADGVRLVANVLEKPVAVEWAANCVRDATGDLPVADAAALDAALAWAGDPSEENRRAASTAAEATDYSTGATWVALAAFWSTGSLAPAGLPDAPPDEGLTAQGLTGALMMAATSTTSGDPNDLYRRFLAIGREKLDI